MTGDPMLHQGLCHFKYKATPWIIEAEEPGHVGNTQYHCESGWSSWVAVNSLPTNTEMSNLASSRKETIFKKNMISVAMASEFSGAQGRVGLENGQKPVNDPNRADSEFLMSGFGKPCKTRCSANENRPRCKLPLVYLCLSRILLVSLRLRLEWFQEKQKGVEMLDS